MTSLKQVKRAAAARNLARMARRLANGQTVGSQRADLMRYADVLDEEAVILERRAQEAGTS
ncbi:hypothetical protein [Reyranella sp.]|uniref:hypothetical protein n=1 Tax=Reyranella sp. TaxID=1929291 RepID=UPI003D09A09A